MLKVFGRKKASTPPTPTPSPSRSKTAGVVVSSPRVLGSAPVQQRLEQPPPLYARFATRGESFDSDATSKRGPSSLANRPDSAALSTDDLRSEYARQVQSASRIYGNESVTRFGAESPSSSRRDLTSSSADDPPPAAKKRPTPSRLSSRTAQATDHPSPLASNSGSAPRRLSQSFASPNNTINKSVLPSSGDLLPPRAPALYHRSNSTSSTATAGSSPDGNSSDASFSSLDSPGPRRMPSYAPQPPNPSDDPYESYSVTSSKFSTPSRPNLTQNASASSSSAYSVQTKVTVVRRDKELPPPPQPSNSRPDSLASATPTIRPSPSASSLVHPAFKRQMPSTIPVVSASAIVHPSQRLRSTPSSLSVVTPVAPAVAPAVTPTFTTSPIGIDSPAQVSQRPVSPVVVAKPVPVQEEPQPKPAPFVPRPRPASVIVPPVESLSLPKAVQDIPEPAPISPVTPPSAHRAPVSASRRASRRMSVEFGTYDIAAARKERESLLLAGPIPAPVPTERRQSLIVAPTPVTSDATKQGIRNDMERQVEEKPEPLRQASRPLPPPPPPMERETSPVSAYEERRRNVVDDRRKVSAASSSKSRMGEFTDHRDAPAQLQPTSFQKAESSTSRVSSSPFKVADSQARSQVDSNTSRPALHVASLADGPARSRATSEDTIQATSSARALPAEPVPPPTKLPQRVADPTPVNNALALDARQTVSQSSSVSSAMSSAFSNHTASTSMSVHENNTVDTPDGDRLSAMPFKIRKKRNVFSSEQALDESQQQQVQQPLPSPSLSTSRQRVDSRVSEAGSSKSKSRPLPVPGNSQSNGGHLQPEASRQRVDSTMSRKSEATSSKSKSRPLPIPELQTNGHQYQPEASSSRVPDVPASPHPSVATSHSEPSVQAEPTFYPLEYHLLQSDLLANLIKYLSFRETLPLLSLTMAIKKAMEEVWEVKEVVLERFLSESVGYRRWTEEGMGRRKESLSLTLRDLNSYMRGISFPPHHYFDVADSFLGALADSTSTDPNLNRRPVPKHLTNQVRMMASSSRAFTKVVVRLRAQADAEEAHLPPPPPSTPDGGNRGRNMPRGQHRMPATGPGTHPPTTGPSQGLSRRSPSPAFSFTSYDRHGPGSNGSGPMLAPSVPTVSTAPGKFRSPLYRSGNAPLLRVFVPSPEGAWLSDSSVLECERELKRAGVISLLKAGDVVHDLAAGDEGNTGRLIWDGNYLIDLDYTYSHLGEIPRYIDSLAFPPSYFHKIVRTSGNPIVHMDLAPFAGDIAAHLQLLQDRIQTDTPQGGHHTVVRYVHRARFRVRPGTPVNTKAPAVAGPDGSTFIRMIDSGWHGTIVIEAEGTNEGLADLQARVGNGVMLFPVKNIAGGGRRPSGDTSLGNWDPRLAGVPGEKSVFRLMRAQSRPGEIWLRCVREKEKIM